MPTFFPEQSPFLFHGNFSFLSLYGVPLNGNQRGGESGFVLPSNLHQPHHHPFPGWATALQQFQQSTAVAANFTGRLAALAGNNNNHCTAVARKDGGNMGMSPFQSNKAFQLYEGVPGFGGRNGQDGGGDHQRSYSPHSSNDSVTDGGDVKQRAIMQLGTDLASEDGEKIVFRQLKKIEKNWKKNWKKLLILKKLKKIIKIEKKDWKMKKIEKMIKN